jgi:hypothetical protein
MTCFGVTALTLRNLHKHYNIFAMHAPWLSWQFQMSCARVALGLDPQLKVIYVVYDDQMLRVKNLPLGQEGVRQ